MRKATGLSRLSRARTPLDVRTTRGRLRVSAGTPGETERISRGITRRGENRSGQRDRALRRFRYVIGSRSGRETRVTNIREERVGSAHRVSADVDGIPLWFESEDVNLAAAPEAFGSALLLVSLHHRRKLVIDAPVSATWVENIQNLFPIWRDWWGYKPIMPDLVTRTDSSAKPRDAKALLFSGGVDSFYSVLNASRHDFFVSIHGFYIPLAY